MHRIRNRIASLLLVGVLTVTALPAASATTEHRQSGFNNEYVFATSRGLADMDDVHPALKLTLFPVTIVLDTVLLPFALIAGAVT